MEKILRNYNPVFLCSPLAFVLARISLEKTRYVLFSVLAVLQQHTCTVLFTENAVCTGKVRTAV